MFSFKAFLLFWERVARERVAENEGILARKKQLLQLVLVLAKYGKISNAQVAGLVVTVFLDNWDRFFRTAVTADPAV